LEAVLSKPLFYVVYILVSGIMIAVVLKVANLPDHFWSYFFAFGFIWLCLLELSGFLYKKLFPGEKIFGGKKQN